MRSIVVRDATDLDLPGVLRVLSESGIDGGKHFTLDEARDHLAQLRQTPGYRLLVAVVEDEIAGTYALSILGKLGKRGTPAGVVEDVGVLPSAQGQGIGRAMMAHAIEACRAAGCYKLALSSNIN